MEAARQVGFEFKNRSMASVTLCIFGEDVAFEVLNVMEYSSERWGQGSEGWVGGGKEGEGSGESVGGRRPGRHGGRGCCDCGIGLKLTRGGPGCRRGCMSVIARAPDGTIRIYCKARTGPLRRHACPLPGSSATVLLALTMLQPLTLIRSCSGIERGLSPTCQVWSVGPFLQGSDTKVMAKLRGRGEGSQSPVLHQRTEENLTMFARQVRGLRWRGWPAVLCCVQVDHGGRTPPSPDKQQVHKGAPHTVHAQH